MSEGCGMEPVDWLNAGFNVAIGVFLGLALNGLLQLVVDGFWPVALIVGTLCAGAVLTMFAFDGLIGRLTERVFPSGIRPSQSPQKKRRKPVARLISLPAGMLLGVILAQFGLTQTILGLF